MPRFDLCASFAPFASLPESHGRGGFPQAARAAKEPDFGGLGVCGYYLANPRGPFAFINSMRARHIRILITFVLLSLLLLLVVISGPASLSNQQQTHQQKRPRTVGNQNTNKSAASQPSKTSGEEVDEGDIVRVETQLVTVPAVVTDKNGHPVSSLKLNNFAVLEDGKAQQLTNFATTEAPFEIALLLDTSGSTRQELGLIRDAANEFLSALRPGDRVALVGFN